MRFSIGIPIVDWVYGKQTEEGKLKWLPSIGELSGFVWIVAIDFTFYASLITLAIWLML